MSTELLRASWLAVGRATLTGPALAALVLVIATVPVLDEGYGMQVLRGAGVLLGVAVVTATDDPAGEVLAAAPIHRRLRTLARVVAVSAVVLPVGLAALLLVQLRAPETPVLALGVEALGLALCGLAVGAGVRAWTGNLAASYIAAPVVAGLAFLAYASPKAWAMMQEQTWGPPWAAAQVRWVAVLVAAVAVLALALRDPLEGRA